MSRPFTLHLLRHGEPVMRDAMLGRTDCAVTTKGVADCIAQAARLSFNRLVCSDLRRARVCAKAISAEAAIDPRWRELDFGDWDGVAIADIDRDAMADFWTDPDAAAPPGGEQWSSLCTRVGEAIGMLPPRDTLVVTHGGAIRAALHQLCAIPYRQCWSFALPYAVSVSLTVWPGSPASAQITAIRPCAG